MSIHHEVRPSRASPYVASVRKRFEAAAKEIVREVQGKLSYELDGKPAAALRRLAKQDLDKIVGVLVESFSDRKMGLRELEITAKKELAISAIRRSIARYTEEFMSGDLGPVEYFRRFYCRHFIVAGLPANAISTIDPNLHRVAKKLDQFPMLTRCLEQAIAARAMPQPR